MRGVFFSLSWWASWKHRTGWPLSEAGCKTIWLLKLIQQHGFLCGNIVVDRESLSLITVPCLILHGSGQKQQTVFSAQITTYRKVIVRADHIPFCLSSLQSWLLFSSHLHPERRQVCPSLFLFQEVPPSQHSKIHGFIKNDSRNLDSNFSPPGEKYRTTI